MQYSFEELQRLCKKRRLKRVVLPVVALLLLAVSIGAWYEKTLEAVSKKRVPIQNSLIRAASTKKESLKNVYSNSKKSDDSCYGIQLYYGYKKLNKTHLYPFWEKLKKLGFDCFIKTGDTLPISKNVQQFLICDVAKSKEELNSSKEKAKKHHFDYLIVKAPCKYLKKKAPLKKKQKIEDKPKALQQKSAPNLASTPVDIQRLIKIFNTAPSYDKALEIAKLYFDQKEYDKSLAWAKKANALNKTDPKAWIVSAKSLEKMGKRREAVKLLQFFLKFKDSNEARNLLKEWQ